MWDFLLLNCSSLSNLSPRSGSGRWDTCAGSRCQGWGRGARPAHARAWSPYGPCPGIRGPRCGRGSEAVGGGARGPAYASGLLLAVASAPGAPVPESRDQRGRPLRATPDPGGRAGTRVWGQAAVVGLPAGTLQRRKRVRVGGARNGACGWPPAAGGTTRRGPRGWGSGGLAGRDPKWLERHSRANRGGTAPGCARAAWPRDSGAAAPVPGEGDTERWGRAQSGCADRLSLLRRGVGWHVGPWRCLKEPCARTHTIFG